MLPPLHLGPQPWNNSRAVEWLEHSLIELEQCFSAKSFEGAQGITGRHKCFDFRKRWQFRPTWYIPTKAERERVALFRAFQNVCRGACMNCGRVSMCQGYGRRTQNKDIKTYKKQHEFVIKSEQLNSIQSTNHLLYVKDHKWHKCEWQIQWKCLYECCSCRLGVVGKTWNGLWVNSWARNNWRIGFQTHWSQHTCPPENKCWQSFQVNRPTTIGLPHSF